MVGVVNGIDSVLLFTLVATPFFGAIALAFFPADRHVLIHWYSRIIAASGLAIAAYLFITFDTSDDLSKYIVDFEWLPSLGIRFTLGLSGITVPLVLLNAIIFFGGVLISWNVDHRPKDFFIWLMLLVAGVYGVFASRDLFFLFFFYELAVVPMYLLVGVWGSSTDFGTFLRTKEYGAMKVMLVLVAGSVLVWIAILAMWMEAREITGIADFSIAGLSQVEFSDGFQKLYYPFLMIGFGILAGLWPFHTWSPDGHVAAPTAVSMLHAGVLMKLGAFGILAVGMVILPVGSRFWAPTLIGLGTVNVLYGAISAMGQKDLKYVIGYSSVSHMGYVLMGLGTLDILAVDGAVLQMFSHGIMTALFFAMVGVIYQRTHSRDITVLEGLGKRMGITGVFLAVAGLTSLGLPGFSSFVAELLIFIGTYRTYPILGVLAVIGAAITAVYILRMLGKVFFGPIDEDKWKDLTDANRMETGVAVLLTGFLLLWGLYPFRIVEIIDSGVVP
ncbi:MAG: NADH-quinone oxidoreductase subunit M, partial [SAR202 cluster bacterium]|nr:NADH-quinone oxidoreductase subunit M [SAR202 cluster bacterium]